jgi:hypothetical protein
VPLQPLLLLHHPPPLAVGALASVRGAVDEVARVAEELETPHRKPRSKLMGAGVDVVANVANATRGMVAIIALRALLTVALEVPWLWTRLQLVLAAWD